MYLCKASEGGLKKCTSVEPVKEILRNVPL